MPQASPLVIANGATPPVNKTFTLLNPAAGLNSTADWALKEGAVSGVFPRLSALVGNVNAPGRAPSKRTSLKVRVPSSYVDTGTGQTMVGSALEANISITVPSDFPEAMKADAIAYIQNFTKHTLVTSMVSDGAPAT